MTVVIVVVMVAREGRWPPLSLSVMNYEKSDGDAYLSFLSLTALGLGVRVLVAAAVDDDVVAITVTGAGVVVVVVEVKRKTENFKVVITNHTTLKTFQILNQG